MINTAAATALASVPLASVPLLTDSATLTSTPPANPDRLLIVTPLAFASALAPYREARARQLGQPTELLTLESLADAPGADLPEKLKREFYRRWKAGEVGSVLLVGDVDVMPVRFMVLDRVTAPAFDTAFYASDLYYADLAHPDGKFDDWNAFKEGLHAQYFGEVHGEHHKDGPINRDGISYVPEILVGRWPVSTAEAAGAVARKTIRHQQDLLDSRRGSVTEPAKEAPSQPRRENADGTAPAPVPGSQTPAAPRSPNRTDAQPNSGEGQRPLLSFFFSGGWIDNAEHARKLTASLRDGGEWSVDEHGFYLPERMPSPASLAASFAARPVAIFHTGHGQPWGWEGCFDAGVLAKAPVTARPPLLFSIGCSTAVIATQPPYDGYMDEAGLLHPGTNHGQVFESFPPAPAPLQRNAANASSLAEDSVRQAEGGAIVAIGCVTGSQPCALTLLDGFVKAMQRSPALSAGQWWKDALQHYVAAEHLMELKPSDSWYPPSIFFQGMKFVYLGDPTVRLR